HLHSPGHRRSSCLPRPQRVRSDSDPTAPETPILRIRGGRRQDRNGSPLEFSSIPVRRESLNPMIRRVAFTLITGLLAIANIASAAENPAAPPAVTARSWAIADADSGKLLWSHLPDEPRKAASTTKMMAAYVVLELA